jgi:hypothetical protein
MITPTTLQALGNLGEFVSAVGVVISLVYLTHETRQNTVSVRAASFNSMVQNSLRLLEQTYGNPDLAAFLIRAEQDPSVLTPEERRRWDAYMTAVYRHFGNVVYQYRTGALDQQMWESYERTLRDHLRTPSWGQWFHANRHVFSDALQDHVERLIDELSEERRISP